ncbi:aromatic ring-hydroxylating oxygenase subunit alpha [Brevibacterium litoralis]|uniref:aromatic ring-hydroxylating oxygenase subunit alpha n=1 Tax=Brevibacterium litoralis TaxID=3138935 RepID=UPI0032EC600B
MNRHGAIDTGPSTSPLPSTTGTRPTGRAHRPGDRAVLSDADITTLVTERPIGHSLAAPFYTSPEIFELDMEEIFSKHWLFVATEAEIPDPGDYVTVDVGRHSVILVRDDDEQVRAHRNVCRHRGARLLDNPCGSVGNIVCPYHQWTYRPEGDLVYAESQPADFDRSAFGLRPVNVRSVGGLLFVCFSDTPPDDFDEVAAILEPYLAPFDLRSTAVAHRTDLEEKGNWKLVMENNRECYHCDGSHPELATAYFTVSRYSEDQVPPRNWEQYERYLAAASDLVARKGDIDFPTTDVSELDTRPTGFQVAHVPLDGAGASIAADGKQVSRRLLGKVPTPTFGDLSIHVQPNTWVHVLSDHAVVFSVLPVAADRSIVRTTWLVHPEAVAGADYDVEALTEVWRATNDEDRELVELTQRGVADPGYVPGPYSLVEAEVEAFVNWYVQRLGHALSARTTAGGTTPAPVATGAALAEGGAEA